MATEEIELKELIAKVHEALEGRDNIGGYDLFYIEAFLCELQQLQEKTRWIPIDERLPEARETPYFIAIKYKEAESDSDNIGAICIYDKTDVDYILLEQITHWKEIE